jgi:multicomponent Na+:H+ antiporter subunit G
VNVLVISLFVGGGFFLAVSTLGLLRFPDFFTRAHAVGKSETLGALLVLTGLAVHHGFALDSVKLFLIVIFIALTNPTGIHTLSRAALRSGVTIWTREGEVMKGEEVLEQVPGDSFDSPAEGGQEGGGRR